MAEALHLPGVKGLFAVGLEWRHEDAPPKPKAMRERAQQQGGWGVVCTTSASKVQAGFCAPIAGIKGSKKLTPLASLVADAHPQPWMGLYQLDENRYWYLAIRDGQEVFPDGDHVGPLDELLRIRENHRSQYEEWNSYEGTIQTLADHVNDAGAVRRPKLHDYRPVSPVVPITVAAAVVILGAAGAYAWYAHLAAQKAEQQRALETFKKKQKALEDAELARRNNVPWASKPLAAEAMPACRGAWIHQALASEGWMLTHWTCTLDTALKVETQWVRAGGTAADAPGVVSDDGETSKDVSVTRVAFTRFDRTVIAAVEARRAGWALAHQYHVKLKLDPPPAPPPAMPGTPDPGPLLAPAWSQSPITMTFIAAPWDVIPIDAYDTVPGWRIDSVALDLLKGEWTLGGQLYANEPVPASASIGASTVAAPGAPGASASLVSGSHRP
ncbi:hypothetical protein WT27_13430 [Burkholderia territorii]|uniref:Type IV pilus biosynthesis protein n=1 Tax=Burkholderia territorii TaxID=1503055 RepID=A0A106DR77_9BURK|nr:type 4b pilus protein PilO2 [Burkholderia territorii]KVV40921.1 hypothetical protein WT27_13430 [Burkholderia territorii]KVX33868.1 hypothetical protein WT31_09330 [Burkholderia territorii]